jgi:hypothetical protein
MMKNRRQIWQTPGFRSPRQVRRNDFDGSQWIADLYTFGGILSRIDQATDRRDSPYGRSYANPIEAADDIMCWREPDSGAPKEQVFSFGS